MMTNNTNRFKKKESIDYKTFVDRINNLDYAKSLNGAIYNEIRVFQGTIIGRKLSTNKRFFIWVGDLYDALNSLDIISLSSLKTFVGENASVSLAILLNINVIEQTELTEIEIRSRKGKRVLRCVDDKYVSMSLEEAEAYDTKVKLRKSIDLLQKSIRPSVIEIKNSISTQSSLQDNKDDNVDRKINLGCLILVLLFILLGIPIIIVNVKPDNFSEGFGIVIIFSISSTLLYYLWKSYNNE